MTTKEPEWKCLHAHDACEQMLPGPHCPYCVKSKPPAPRKARSSYNLTQERYEQAWREKQRLR